MLTLDMTYQMGNDQRQREVRTSDDPVFVTSWDGIDVIAERITPLAYHMTIDFQPRPEPTRFYVNGLWDDDEDIPDKGRIRLTALLDGTSAVSPWKIGKHEALENFASIIDTTQHLKLSITTPKPQAANTSWSANVTLYDFPYEQPGANRAGMIISPLVSPDTWVRASGIVQIWE